MQIVPSPKSSTSGWGWPTNWPRAPPGWLSLISPDQGGPATPHPCTDSCTGPLVPLHNF